MKAWIKEIGWREADRKKTQQDFIADWKGVGEGGKSVQGCGAEKVTLLLDRMNLSTSLLPPPPQLPGMLRFLYPRSTSFNPPSLLN